MKNSLSKLHLLAIFTFSLLFIFDGMAQEVSPLLDANYRLRHQERHERRTRSLESNRDNLSRAPMLELQTGTENALSTHDSQSGWNILLGVRTQFNGGTERRDENTGDLYFPTLVAQIRTRMAITPGGEVPYLDLHFVPLQINGKDDLIHHRNSFEAFPVSVTRDIRIGNHGITTVDLLGYKVQGEANLGSHTVVLFQTALEALGLAMERSFKQTITRQIEAAERGFTAAVEANGGTSENLNPDNQVYWDNSSGSSNPSRQYSPGFHAGRIESEISFLFIQAASQIAARFTLGGSVSMNLPANAAHSRFYEHQPSPQPYPYTGAYYNTSLEVDLGPQTIQNAYAEFRAHLARHFDLFTRFDIYRIENRSHVNRDGTFTESGSPVGGLSDYYHGPGNQSHTQLLFTMGAAAHF